MTAVLYQVIKHPLPVATEAGGTNKNRSYEMPITAMKIAEESADPQLQEKIDEAWRRYDAALDALKEAPECPKSGAPNCPEKLRAAQQARQALRDLGVRI